MTGRVSATPAALALLAELQGQHGHSLMFHQSGGCCDGSSPMCLKEGDLLIGATDVLLGEIGGCKFYMNAAQFEHWQHTHLIIDVVEGRGGMFSLDNGTEKRFLTRSRMFTEEEKSQLCPVQLGGA